MDKKTLSSLNSSYIQLFEDSDGKIKVGIALEDVLSGKVLITTNEVTEEDLLKEVSSPAPTIIITNEVASLYSTAGYSKEDLSTDIHDYLKIVASLWSSNNKTESAVTGSLIGKVSKFSSKLNETIYAMVGSGTRDTILKGLIKCNMPTLKYMWEQNK